MAKTTRSKLVRRSMDLMVRFIGICIVVVSTNLMHAQEGTIASLDSSVTDFVLLDSVFVVDSLTRPADPNWSDPAIFDEHWHNQPFNAYADVGVPFPFAIHFSEDSIEAPVDRKMVVTSRFGWRRGRAHRGIDIDLVTKDEVYALLGGKVRHVRHHLDFGKTVIVRHPNGLETVYAHLSSYKVEVNDTVVAGQVLGLGGATGNARGSHLHLEVRYKGVSINPEYFFDFSKGGAIRASELWVTRAWTMPIRHNARYQSDIVIYQSLDEASNVQQKEGEVYVVTKGDTLYSIARRYQLRVSDICLSNSIKSSSTLKIGQQLVLMP